MSTVLAATSEGPTVRAIQEMLAFLGYRGAQQEGSSRPILEADGVFGPHTQAAVMAFQSDEGLLSDGVVARSTLAALEAAWSRRHRELGAPGLVAVDGRPGRLPFEPITADVVHDGYSRIWMRCDAAAALRLVLRDLHAAGGRFATSGGRRALDATLNSTRSATSLHYLGRAVDLLANGALNDPSTDPYVVTRSGTRRFHVHARCTQVNAPKFPETTTLSNVVTLADREGTGTAEGHFVDLTHIFRKHGFHSIAARHSFFEGGSQWGAEWWHFQFERGLVPSVTTFGSELERSFTLDQLAGTGPWANRDRVWGLDWL